MKKRLTILLGSVFVGYMIVIYILSILFYPLDLSNKDPFDSDVQMKVLKEVAKIMNVELSPDILPPTILIAEEVSNEYNDSVWDFDIGDKRSNIFDPKTNNILLIRESEVHNLAHEMAHYIQFNYFGWTLEKATWCSSDSLEWEAIWVQDHFR